MNIKLGGGINYILRPQIGVSFEFKKSSTELYIVQILFQTITMFEFQSH